MTDRELMQQALELLNDINQCSLPPTGIPLPAEIDHVMEALQDRLAQPDHLIQMREVLAVQGTDGNWDRDPYMAGMFNGMELMMAIVEGREPVFRDPPERWLHTPPQREWIGLTDEDIEQIHYGIKCKGIGTYSTNDIYRAIEAKLKEQNT